MSPELDAKLCAKYPEIFRNRHKPMSQTAMCWGFSCGDGWYWLIDTLCRLMMYEVTTLRRQIADAKDLTDESPEWMQSCYSPEKLASLEARLAAALETIPVADQVKEKYGGLRFYADRGTDADRYFIRFAEEMSYRICESCGTTRDVHQTTGWIRTICRPCATTENLLDRLSLDGSEETA